MDKDHVQTSLDEQRRKTGGKREIPRIELGAVLDTTCKKCGGKGHFTKDCYSAVSEKTYELLPDVSLILETEKANLAKSKKHKKEKKRKKKNKHKKHESSSDSEDQYKHKKKKKKDK